MNRAERVATITSWLERGESFTIPEAARRLDEAYLNVWRDVIAIERVLPVARDYRGRVYLIRINSKTSAPPP